MSSKLPSTSIQAYKSLSVEQRQRHHKLILAALNVRNMIYEEIAIAAGFTDKTQVGRRLKELVDDGKIFRLQTTKPTTTGRMAAVYSLYPSGSPTGQLTIPYKQTLAHT